MQRICKKCGWVYPSVYTRTKCKYCGSILDMQHCLYGNHWAPVSEFSFPGGHRKQHCKACHTKNVSNWYKEHPGKHNLCSINFRKKHRGAAEKAYQDWMEEISTLPFKPMTEAEWLTTCSYFHGCALCKEEYIEIRQFFVPFKAGGRYAVWNMFPLCGKCAVKPPTVENPFIWFDRYIPTNFNTMDIPEVNIDRLVAYLKEQIERSKQVEKASL